MPRSEDERASPKAKKARGTSSPSPARDGKRKRSDPVHSELEVDINAPEPPSKKSKRLLKKGKSLPVKPNSPSPSRSRSRSPSPSRSSNKITIHADANGNGNGNSDTPATTATTAATTKATKKKPRSEHGIWIGNLPFDASASSLAEFLAKNASLAPSDISRIHLPASSGPRDRNAKKPANKGFAYVDFSSSAAHAAALALSETLLGGRRVLIKDARSYEGRPDKKKKSNDLAGSGNRGGGEGEEEEEGNRPDGKNPGKRVFVGNLRYDVERDELRRHFERCGAVDDLFLATFEDSGKCKGYAWVTFAEAEGARSAVRGWVLEEQDDEDEDEDGGGDDEDMEAEAEENGDGSGKRKERKNKSSKKKKPRKVPIDRFHGRPMRLEFGEDPAHRYKKRFGKAPPPASQEGNGDAAGGGEATATGEKERRGRDAEQRRGARAPSSRQPFVKKDPSSKQQQRRDGGGGREARPSFPKKKVDARTVQPGAANARAPRASAAIVASQGTKITFD